MSKKSDAWLYEVERWKVRYRIVKSDAYDRGYVTWTEWCDSQGLKPWKAKSTDIEIFLNSFRGTLAEATIALRYDAVSALYRHMFREGVLKINPVAVVSRPKINKEGQRRTFLTPLEYAAFLSAARQMGPDAHAVAAIGGMMGLRSNEMCQLDISSVVNVSGYQALKFIGKGGKPSTSPMPIPVLRPVTELLLEREDGPLLRTKWGTRLNCRSLGHLVQRIARVADISHDITPHGLRRTFATAGFARGVSLRDMQVSMRHARPETTMIYDMDQLNMDRHASHQIASFLSGLAS